MLKSPFSSQIRVNDIRISSAKKLRQDCNSTAINHSVLT